MTLKKISQNSLTIDATKESAAKEAGKNGKNGGTPLVAEPGSADLSMILASLHAVRNGDFSVRLPGSWTGLPGKIADSFNEIVSANQQMARELKRIGQTVGKEGRT